MPSLKPLSFFSLSTISFCVGSIVALEVPSSTLGSVRLVSMSTTLISIFNSSCLALVKTRVCRLSGSTLSLSVSVNLKRGDTLGPPVRSMVYQSVFSGWMIPSLQVKWNGSELSVTR